MYFLAVIFPPKIWKRPTVLRDIQSHTVMLTFILYTTLNYSNGTVSKLKIFLVGFDFFISIETFGLLNGFVIFRI